DPILILLRQPPRHLLAKPEGEKRDRQKHDGGKREKQTCAESHHLLAAVGVARINPPSHSVAAPALPRRTMACSRVSAMGTIVSRSSQGALSIVTANSRHGSSGR